MSLAIVGPPPLRACAPREVSPQEGSRPREKSHNTMHQIFRLRRAPRESLEGPSRFGSPPILIFVGVGAALPSFSFVLVPLADSAVATSTKQTAKRQTPSIDQLIIPITNFNELVEYFKEYAEDYNTATMPHIKYYDYNKLEMEEYAQ